MIRFADNGTVDDVKSMWKRCFGDSDEFMQLYFSYKYKNENTLIYIDENRIVASLQMLPYDIRFYGSVIPSAYISGACTLPEYRGNGYMKELLIASFKVMQQRNIPVSILIPAEEWLYDFYAKYGYEKTFDNGNEKMDLDFLSSIDYENFEEMYNIFDRKYQQKDFLVLKNENDFRTIRDEYLMEDFPAKYNLAGMSRIINARLLLSLYAKANNMESFTIRVSDEILNENSGIYRIEKGEVRKTENFTPDMETDIRLLDRLLWGYHTSELQEDYNKRFKEHQPVMNLMLE